MRRKKKIVFLGGFYILKETYTVMNLESTDLDQLQGFVFRLIAAFIEVFLPCLCCVCFVASSARSSTHSAMLEGT
jgi:hypothetical protein